jgi:hypothetical protein
VPSSLRSPAPGLSRTTFNTQGTPFITWNPWLRTTGALFTGVGMRESEGLLHF